MPVRADALNAITYQGSNAPVVLYNSLIMNPPHFCIDLCGLPLFLDLVVQNELDSVLNSNYCIVIFFSCCLLIIIINMVVAVAAIINSKQTTDAQPGEPKLALNCHFQYIGGLAH